MSAPVAMLRVPPAREQGGGKPVVPGKLRGLGVRPASELAAEDRLLPVRADLAGALPFGGLRRGSTVAVLGSTSLTLAMLAEASAHGHSVAVVGRPDLGVLAACELGVDPDMLALVPEPGQELLAVLDALFDGFAAVAVAARCLDIHGGRRAALAGKLIARARHRRSVLLVDAPLPGADVVVRAGQRRWSGPDGGHGALCEQRLSLIVEGGGHTGSRPVELALPRMAPVRAGEGGEPVARAG